MKKENEPNRKLILYVLIGLFIVIVFFLTAMGVGQLTSTQKQGTSTTTPKSTITVPKATK